MDDDLLHCRFGIPAHWTPDVVAQMESVITEAGIPNCAFIHESKAAASNIIRRNQLEVKRRKGSIESWLMKVA